MTFGDRPRALTRASAWLHAGPQAVTAARVGNALRGGWVERNHRMELQYDGTGLHGWAKQDGLQTVEGCLEEAFRTVLGEAPALRVAGRTDAGVHARRQVVEPSSSGRTGSG